MVEALAAAAAVVVVQGELLIPLERGSKREESG